VIHDDRDQRVTGSSFNSRHNSLPGFAGHNDVEQDEVGGSRRISNFRIGSVLHRGNR